jgi:hypothetical protein
MDDLTFEILPRSPELGGGWRLKLFQASVEVGGGVFPAVEHGLQNAYEDAQACAYEWLESFEG